ncbi:unnamed protein product [Prunus armeniaca]
MGKGDIQIRTKNDFVQTIANIFFIPDLKTSLLSAGQLQDKGYMITIFKGKCEVYDPKRGSIAVVKMSSNKLFPLKIKTVQASLLTIEDNSWRWHYIYGHLNFNGLRTLHQNEMVTGLPEITPPSKEKSKAFDAFKSFKTLAENETDKKIKTLKTDRGGEFCSKEFDFLCREKGIKRHLTTAYMPQQNGVSKRKN